MGLYKPQRTPISIRPWLNKNKRIVGITSIVTLLLFMVILLFRIFHVSGPAVITRVYFYDLETDKLFAADVNSLPPIPAPSGKKTADGQDVGVHALVFSCGDCADEKKRFIGYVETMTPEAKEAASAAAAQPAYRMAGNPLAASRLIKDPAAKGDWIPINDPLADQLKRETYTKCGQGAMPNPCYPPQ